MRAVDIIGRKRNGEELSREEIAFLVSGYTQNRIPDYQMSAFLMAVSLIGMTEQETLVFTEEMLMSGSVLDLSDLPGEKIDKHSTGGVGDKTSIVVAPLAAAAGVVVPMISGRSLGHTGGTLDKLEAIPGFDVGLDLGRFRDVLEKAGCALIGPTEEIAPADGKLYPLRDATATVDSIPLITGSILSKKLAEGIGGLVLDVKVGSGAYMKELDSAMELGRHLVSIARLMGIPAVSLVTDMDQPLGRRVGNALEIEEAVEILRGSGPRDLRDLCLLLTAHMLVLAKAAPAVEEGKAMAARLLDSGAGLEKLVEVVALQQGDPRVVEDPARLTKASNQKDVTASRTGYVARIDTEAVGAATMLMGAGRAKLGDRIDHSVGIIVHRKLGDWVSQGEPLVTLHYNGTSRLQESETLVAAAYEIHDEPPAAQPLVRAIIDMEQQSV
jgi:pyrimidine-nucleoside phosphorylase